jgi:hypothetical protein
MAISARDELKHLAESLDEREAEACRALLALVDAAPRQCQYDSALLAVADQGRHSPSE